MTDVTAYIGLGSNLDGPRARVKAAIDELDTLPHTRVQASSSLYRSAPMGPQDQPDYINAVAQIGTSLEAETLLDALQAIEQAHGRVRDQHWGPRTLDLDILLYGDALIDTPRLKVPHPGMAERNFVLYPLAEIGGDLVIPGLGGIRSLLSACPENGLERLASCA